MATAEELKKQIVDARRRLEASGQRYQQLEADKVAALERQRLREELESINEAFDDQEWLNKDKQEEITAVNADQNTSVLFRESKVVNSKRSKFVSGNEATCCNSSVVKGEFVWTIEGMSWLSNTLEQTGKSHVEAPSDEFFDVGGHEFDFRYAPTGCYSDDRHGSLVISHHWTDAGSVALRYKILIRRAQSDRDFVLWGAGNQCFKTGINGKIQIFGPDVQARSDQSRPSGLFGLTHEELLSSEWIHQDTMTVKFELEIRTKAYPETCVKDALPDIIPSTLSANLLGSLEDGKCSDITFIVQGHQIKAHSQILSARSEYFHKVFTGGLRESISKEVVIDDCDVESFKALLSFLYSDDFSHIELVIKTASTLNDGCQQDQSKAKESTNEADTYSALLLSMLALSHKYQITRLQSWCEHKLSSCLSVTSVCLVLQQAHLLETKQLERECYKLIKSNLPAVLATSAYVKMLKEWPEVALKIHLFSSGLPESDAASLLEKQLKTMNACSSKRKRDD